jgi:hypothetical protein
VVLRDGNTIARIYQHEHGPQTGKWAWSGQWVEVYLAVNGLYPSASIGGEISRP